MTVLSHAISHAPLSTRRRRSRSSTNSVSFPIVGTEEEDEDDEEGEEDEEDEPMLANLLVSPFAFAFSVSLCFSSSS